MMNKDFSIVRTLDIHELQSELIELVHTPTGARVMHLKNEDPENLFCLSFRTYPYNSNGVAHILEHTVLCGSEKFPVKDPFFAMTRRSLNTFMNALTGADFTCYPAASQVKKDFYNLLEVYLDAVFHPNLLEKSFMQEGHRLEFAEPENPDSPLEFKGIVFNEMKGAMASMDARMGEAMDAAMFPDITYGFNSGGEPADIPELTYEQLLDFHRTYYHPSRCLFFFYGDMPLEEHLDFIAENALKNVEKLDDLKPVPKQPRFSEPVRNTVPYSIARDEDTAEKTMISCGWLTCHIQEQEELLALLVLDLILMQTDASPLKMALLRSGLCKQAFSYMHDSMSEIPYTLNLKGCDPENADKIETLILDTLKEIVAEGIPKDAIENAMHQLEIQRSEILGDSYPFGLVLFMRAALLEQHGGSPEDALKIHSLFNELREDIKNDPKYLEKILQKLMIENPHFVRITLVPDPDLTEKENEEERKKLDAIRAEMSDEEVEQVIKSAADLAEFQKEQEHQDLDVLPKVTLEDVPKESRDYPLTITESGKMKVFHHQCFTNEILYADLVYDLPEIAEEDLPYLPIFTSLLTQVGSGGRDYAENLEFMQAHTGGISAGLSLHPQADDYAQFSPIFSLQGKALYRKADKLFELLRDTVESADFSDVERLREIIEKKHVGLESSLVQNAMSYAMNLSASGIDPSARLYNTWHGLEHLWKIREIANNFDAQSGKLIEKLNQMKEMLLQLENPHLVLSCDAKIAEKLASADYYGLRELSEKGKSFQSWKGEYSLGQVQSHARDIATPVAFTAMAMKSFPFAHPDTPALKIAAQLFDNVYLHGLIREQGGAYGGGAANRSATGNFYFYAYRDPNIASSVDAFSRAVEQIKQGEFKDSDLEEAKLETIQGLDNPVSPGTRAEVAYSWWREGKSLERRQAYRERLLAVSREEVIQVVSQHVLPKMQEATLVVFAGSELVERENAGMTQKLPLETV